MTTFDELKESRPEALRPPEIDAGTKEMADGLNEVAKVASHIVSDLSLIAEDVRHHGDMLESVGERAEGLASAPYLKETDELPRVFIMCGRAVQAGDISEEKASQIGQKLREVAEVMERLGSEASSLAPDLEAVISNYDLTISDLTNAQNEGESGFRDLEEAASAGNPSEVDEALMAKWHELADRIKGAEDACTNTASAAHAQGEMVTERMATVASTLAYAAKELASETPGY